MKKQKIKKNYTSVRLTGSEREFLKELGDGNMGKGLREVLKINGFKYKESQ